jgi:hypothetical protein
MMPVQHGGLSTYTHSRDWQVLCVLDEEEEEERRRV